MDTVLELYNKILYGTLCPLSKDIHNQQKYQQLLYDLNEACCKIHPLYQVNFLKPLLPKRKYFSVLIEEEARQFLHQLNREADAAISGDEKSFFINEALKNLDLKLERAAFMIRRKGFNSDMISHSNYCCPINDPSDTTYVLAFLKFQLIRLYMEVQDQYQHYINREVLSMEDIHLIYFGATATVSTYIVKVPQLFTPKIYNPEPLPVEAAFQPKTHDVRMPVAGVLPYDDIVAQKTRFARLESVLFENHLIDHAYQFQRKPRGNVLKMAAVYRVSYGKGYFQNHYFKGKQRIEITAKEVQAFLNHRYHIHIDKEFRNFKEASTLNTYLSNEPWISVIDRL